MNRTILILAIAAILIVAQKAYPCCGRVKLVFNYQGDAFECTRAFEKKPRTYGAISSMQQTPERMGKRMSFLSSLVFAHEIPLFQFPPCCLSSSIARPINAAISEGL